MPKKQRNSFYFFMLDYKKSQEDLGRRFNGGLRDISEEAGEKWKTMPASARSKYDKMAKDFKSGPQARKYTTTGEPIDKVLQRKTEIEEAEKQKKETVLNLVSDRKTAIEKIFFVIDVNYYCQTKDLFVINEISIVAFNVLEGVNLVFHKIIDPVTIPLGFTSYAKESEDEHSFKLPPLEMGESNPAVVLSEMLDFVQQVNAQGRGATPLFTLEDRSKAVESFLQQMCGIYEDINRFALYPISTLFYGLSQKLSTDKDKSMPHESVALIALKADKFQYCSTLACNYHNEVEKFYNCTKSRAKRWVYTILDYCYPLAGVEPISGDHVPDDIDPTEAYHFKNKREEWREREKREARERETSKDFLFVDYAKMDERERRRHDATAVTPLVLPAAACAKDRAWPSLGGPQPAARVRNSQGAWGAAAAKPQAVAWSTPGAASAVESVQRTPLRKPATNAETMLAQLTSAGGDTIGITRGRGRDSITSIYND